MLLRMGEHELELGGPYLGELSPSTPDEAPEILRRRLADDGVLLLRGLHDADQVRAARRVMLECIAAEGKLDPDAPLMDGVMAPGAKDGSFPRKERVTRSPEFLGVVEAPALMEFFSRLLDGPVLTYDNKWIRAIATGSFTGAHYDIVYMGRGTQNVLTCWTPLGDVDYPSGPLALWSGSNRLEQVKQTYGKMDVDRDHVEGWFSNDPVELVDRYGGRWLTAEFAAGDALVFGMFMMHGSLNNMTNRLRLSTDTRYQRADEPVDERWIGENPLGHYAWHKGETVRMADMREKWGV